MNKLQLRSMTSEILDQIDRSEQLVLLGYTGSIAYGLDDENSDIDIMGVVIPSARYYLGLPSSNEFPISGSLQKKSGQFDITLYELKKFISLALQGNPSILSCLWLEPDYYLTKKRVGYSLLNNKDMFCGKHVVTTFMGYARQQFERMNRDDHKNMGAKSKELIQLYGYDCQHASHLVRILRMGIEFLTTGELQVHRRDADELLAIKRGNWKFENVISMVSGLFNDLEKVKEQSTLPDYPNYEKVDNWLTYHLSEYLYETD